MNIQTLLSTIGNFLNSTILPALLGLAFFIFLWNAFRYFILGGGNEESQDKAKSLTLWSIAAFVIILSLWGVVNMLVYGLGFGRNDAVGPDYMCTKNGGSCTRKTSVHTPAPIPVPKTESEQTPASIPTVEPIDFNNEIWDGESLDMDNIIDKDLRTIYAAAIGASPNDSLIITERYSNYDRIEITILNKSTNESVAIRTWEDNNENIVTEVTKNGRTSRFRQVLTDSGDVAIYTESGIADPTMIALVMNQELRSKAVKEVEDIYSGPGFSDEEIRDMVPPEVTKSGIQ
jgi:hypothetical protein